MYKLLMNQYLGDPENVMLQKGSQMRGKYKPLSPADFTVAVWFNVLCLRERDSRWKGSTHS